MAQEVKIAGALFSDVPSIRVPDSNDVYHPFVDVSGTTATASDVASGKKFYSSDGTETTGTASGGSATLITKSITANGTYDATDDNADGYSEVTVNVSGGGGTSAEWSDVNFIDYDGTVLYSYTAAQALALTELPANPSHSGLVAQGWNYTLAQMQAQVTASGTCEIGQMYITESGDTEIDVEFVDSARLSPILTIAVNGTITVDWGDGSTADTVTGTSLTSRKEVPHTYASVGKYTIVIHVTSGSFSFYGGDRTYTLLRKNTTANENRVYSSSVKAIRLGSGITVIGSYAFSYCYSLKSVTIPSVVTSIGSYAFCYCYSLKSVTIPSVVTSIGGSAFQNCTSLSSITIPSVVTSIGSYAFYNCYSFSSITIPDGVTSIGGDEFYGCYSLSSITIPDGVTSIGNYAFYNCYSLSSIKIPDVVTSIGNTAFQNCYSLKSVTIPSVVTSIGNTAFRECYGVAEYHVQVETPPTLGTNAFQNIVSDCKIYVPSASLAAYQSATNWSTYASYMVGE